MHNMSSARKHGCQPPLATQQVLATAGQLLFSGLGIAASYLVPESHKTANLTVYTLLSFIVLVCWLYCELTDPAEPGGIPCLCMSVTQNMQPRYCRINNKYIPGFDHHCEWLNTAVGKRNYFFFYMIALCGTLQHLFHLIFIILSLTTIGTDTSDGNITVILIIYAVILLLPVGSFGSLLAFHTYLLTLGYGTYDWMMRRAEARIPESQRQAMEKARQRAANQQKTKKYETDIVIDDETFPSGAATSTRSHQSENGNSENG